MSSIMKNKVNFIPINQYIYSILSSFTYIHVTFILQRPLLLSEISYSYTFERREGGTHWQGHLHLFDTLNGMGMHPGQINHMLNAQT